MIGSAPKMANALFPHEMKGRKENIFFSFLFNTIHSNVSYIFNAIDTRNTDCSISLTQIVMETNEAATNSWATMSPKRAPSSQQVLPDSPDYMDRYNTNSDDLRPTSNLNSSTSSTINHLLRQQNLVVVGSHEKPITLGRGGSNTIKIGRRNRQISRVHVSIAFNNDTEQFELTVLGLNGACVDNVSYDQHGVAPLEDNSFIDVVGDQFRFKMPPPPSSVNFAEKLQQQQQEVQQVVIQKNMDILKEMSPEAEEQQEEIVVEAPIEEPALPLPTKQEIMEVAPIDQTVTTASEKQKTQEEDAFPSDLLPDEALSPIEKELSPEINVDEEIIEPVKEEIIQPVQETKPAEKKLTKKEIRKALKREDKKKALILQEKKKQHLEEDSNDYAEVIIDALGKKIQPYCESQNRPNIA